MGDNSDGFFVKGSIEDAYKRAQEAWEEMARSRIEEEVVAPDWQEVIDYFVSLDEESDRAIPILAFAYIDTEIERLIRDAVNPNVSGGLSRLFGPLGPLGSASTRINMAHAMRWLSDDTAHDLHLLRRIRNRFAHQRLERGLRDSETIADLVDHRFLPRILDALFGDARDALSESGLDLRVLMTLRSHIVAASVVSAWRAFGELYVAPISTRTGVHPSALLDAHSASAPQGIKEQHELMKPMMEALIVGPIQERSREIVEIADRVEAEEE